jgi:hypothetical protein
MYGQRNVTREVKLYCLWWTYLMLDYAMRRDDENWNGSRYQTLCWVVLSCDFSHGIWGVYNVEPLFIDQYSLLLEDTYGEWFPKALIFKDFFLPWDFYPQVLSDFSLWKSRIFCCSLTLYYDHGTTCSCFCYHCFILFQ